VGIGATPPTVFSGHSYLQIGAQAVLAANKALSATGQTYLTHNLYYDASGTLQVFNTTNANEGCLYQQSDGIHYWSSSAATTGTPTVTERMRIDSSGNVGIGVTPAQKLDVDGTIKGVNFLLDAIVASNYDIKMVRASGDSGANTVQTYWNIAYGAAAAGGCLGAYDRSGNYAAPGSVIAGSNTWTIYGFIGVAP
jgi:hypothetical protein